MNKRVFIATGAALALAGVALAGFETLAGNAAYEGKTGLKDLLVAVDANFANSTAQTDTNATTSLASYTPRFVGDVLLGKQGATNWVWVGRSLATNGWQAVAP